MNTIYLRRLEELLFCGMILAAPLEAMPKRFSIPFLGSNLEMNFLVLAIFFFVVECFIQPECWRRIPHKKFLALFCGWMVLTLLAGAVCYPIHMMTC